MTRPTAARVRKTAEATAAAAKILPGKAGNPARRKAAKTIKDWAEEEATEQEGRPITGTDRLTTPEQMVVGSSYSISTYSRPGWIAGDGTRIHVSLYFPEADAIIDYPDSESDAKERAEFFKGARVPYLAVTEGNPLDPKVARELLKKQGARIKL